MKSKMLKLINNKLAGCLILIGAGVTFTAIADGDDGYDHSHGDVSQEIAGMQPHDDAGHGATHRHPEWVQPPEEYAGRTSDHWSDSKAVARGQEIYENVCVVCHGVDGRGTGQIAETLSHPPADLTSHFHAGTGEGDDYLFWRVSEGGTVEPFRSMDSAMPAFKDLLSEDERWDVLAYVHVYFHLGLRWSPETAGENETTYEQMHTESGHQH